MSSHVGASGSGPRRVVWGVVVALAVLHWDFWWWDSTTLVFGFLPVALAYHALFSLACGVTWWAVSQFAWPDHIERWAEGDGGGGSS